MLGLVKAGEFRSGNNREIGDSFSGVRIGYPGFSYPGTSTETSDIFNIVGADADTLQFGLRASDGVAIAGGGNVYLDVEGVNIVQGQADANAVTWWSTDGENTVMDIYSFWAAGVSIANIRVWGLRSDTTTLTTDEAWDAQLEMGAYSDSGSSGHALYLFMNRQNEIASFRFEGRSTDITGSSGGTFLTRPLVWSMDCDGVSTMDFNDPSAMTFPTSFVWNTPSSDIGNSLDDIELLRLDLTAEAPSAEFGGSDSNARWLTLDTASIVVNDGGADRDFRIEGDNQANLFHVDAGNDRIGIHTGVPQGMLHLLLAAAGSVLTYESSADNFIIEDDTHAGLQIITPTNMDGAIYFVDSDASAGRLAYSHADDRFELDIAATVSAIWDANGLALGNFAPAAELHADSAIALTGVAPSPGDPDTEVIKIWADTDGELRLTDSASEDWYLTKSTSTGGGRLIESHMPFPQSSGTSTANAAAWVNVIGSDSGVNLDSTNHALRLGHSLEVTAFAAGQPSISQINQLGIQVLDSLGAEQINVLIAEGEASTRVTLNGGFILDTGMLSTGDFDFVTRWFLTGAGDITFPQENTLERGISVKEWRVG